MSTVDVAETWYDGYLLLSWRWLAVIPQKLDNSGWLRYEISNGAIKIRHQDHTETGHT
jgi:hypothetical protein